VSSKPPISKPPVPKPVVPVTPPKPSSPVELITISVINESTVATDAQLEQYVAALQKQVDNDFGPIWGVEASLTFVPKGGKPNPNTWQLGVFDNSDQAGALGYHDVTSAGLPLAKVFAETDIQARSSLSVTISHELLEMLGDPDVNLCVLVQSTDTEGVIYAYETADAVEDDSFGYTIDGVLVSDFVYPSWFESFRTTGPFDKQGKVTKPFELLAGGYISTYNIPNTGGWTQLNAQSNSKYMNRARLGSRREKRRTPRDQWIRSTRG